MMEKNEGENKRGGILNLVDLGLGTTSKDFSNLVKSSEEVGQAIGAALSMINNMERLPDKKQAYTKILSVLAFIIGPAVDGAREANTAYNEKFELPTEQNKKLKAHLSELNAIKSNAKLEEEILAVSKELKIPMPIEAKMLPRTKEDVNEEINNLGKQLMKLKSEHRKLKKEEKSRS